MKKLFNKDFFLVVIGQIISLFGNQILRFALPLYLLNQTGSAALFGTISAISFIPMIILCPIGGIIADRINKRNIMVILDFSTAILTTILCLLLGKVDIVLLLLVVMIILYGIQGAYQPAVQSSIPSLVNQEQIMSGNAIINLVNSLAGLLGPVLGGFLFSLFGIYPLLYVSIGCFSFSAVMEIFINIPFTKQKGNGSIFSIAKQDLSVSFHFIKKDQPSIFKVCILFAGINLFLTSLVIIGLPVIITESLGFSAATGNRFYGYSQGAFALGSLVGGMSAGVLSKKIKATYSTVILLICTLSIFPMALALHFLTNNTAIYVILLLSCFTMMLFASLLSIQMMSYLQILTPNELIGKVISCAMCISMCATPLGQAIFGGLFEICKTHVYIPFYISAAICLVITIVSKPIFTTISSLIDVSDNKESAS